ATRVPVRQWRLACSPITGIPFPHRLLGGEVNEVSDNHRNHTSNKRGAPAGARGSLATISAAPSGAESFVDEGSGGFAALHHRGGGWVSWRWAGRASRLISRTPPASNAGSDNTGKILLSSHA